MRFTRRTLIRGAVTIGSGLALGPLSSLVKRRAVEAAARLEPAERPALLAAAAESVPVGQTPTILYDLTQCIGCRFCQVGCQANKDLPPDISLISFEAVDPGTTATQGEWSVRRHSCFHCAHPACASACPVSAMYKTPEGPVIYRDERCLGCRYCIDVCPFHVPTYDWNSGLMEKPLVRKCDFCYDRLQQGRVPACIEACPTGAVTFGKRDELLAQARARIQENPSKYVPEIYGESEVGGTSFLIIASVPFEKLHLPQPGSKPLTELPEKIMAGVLPFGLVWTLLLSGVAGLARLKERKEEQS